MTAEVGGRGGIMQTSMETSSHKRSRDGWNVRRSLDVTCLSYQCLWLMMHRREGYWGGPWKQVTVQVSRSVKWCLCELHLILCTTLGTLLLWLCLEQPKMWYFYSPTALPLSYWSSVGREQEGSVTCLSSSADLLCNPCPSPWGFFSPGTAWELCDGRILLEQSQVVQGSARRR